MYIESLALHNYRNYEELNIEFSKGINILYGNNAQGKTNILESIYLAATTKSHRGSYDKEIIRFNQDETHIRANIIKREVPHRIDMHLKKNKNKGVAIDGLPIRKSADLFGLINIIFFSPEDLAIVKSGPSERRRFIDMELCQLNRIYFSDLASYNKIVNQRNNLLKQINFFEGAGKFNDKNKEKSNSLRSSLDVWDMQLVEYGKRVIKERENFISMLNDIIKDIHSELTSGNEEINLIYEKNVSEEDYEKDLLAKRESDIKYCSTQIGPHRDDMAFIIDDIDVRTYGSQGQQRTAALSLKLAEIKLVRKIINDDPVLLLDDVMSELDTNRRNALLSAIKDIQTLITCTGYDDFIQERLQIDKIYNVVKGHVTEKTC